MKKVAAYCRVSTGSDAQEESLETQREHYESYIKCNPEWEYAGLYYDDGMLSKQAKVQRADKRISEIQKFMKAHEKSRLEYDDSLVRKYINAITVYHERFHFEFKAGLETDVWRNK